MSTIERLEARRLLSSSLSGGVLTITGTGGADKIDVTLAGSNVKVDEHAGSVKTFAASKVRQIQADLKGGNDQISSSESIAVPTTLSGGSGHDKLYGQADNDTLIGNDGEKNTLDGGTGSDKAKKDGIDSVISIETFI
jgi:Ca2+-binding RTX toxin-like protein